MEKKFSLYDCKVGFEDKAADKKKIYQFIFKHQTNDEEKTGVVVLSRPQSAAVEENEFGINKLIKKRNNQDFLDFRLIPNQMTGIKSRHRAFALSEEWACLFCRLIEFGKPFTEDWGEDEKKNYTIIRHQPF